VPSSTNPNINPIFLTETVFKRNIPPLHNDNKVGYMFVSKILKNGEPYADSVEKVEFITQSNNKPVIFDITKNYKYNDSANTEIKKLSDQMTKMFSDKIGSEYSKNPAGFELDKEGFHIDKQFKRVSDIDDEVRSLLAKYDDAIKYKKFAEKHNEEWISSWI